MVFGVFYFNLICLAIYFSTFGFNIQELDLITKQLLFFMVLVFPIVLVLLKAETAHIEHVQKMLKNISDQ